ncbi:MAG: hypothetical protein RLZZ282_502 [Verrucomicrobiota bacterium]
MPDDPSFFEPSRRQWVGFWSMIVQQTQNAFNDKMAQFILIPLGGAVGFAVESVAGLLIALPFVLFAPMAGWLSDRFSKRDVMFGSAIVQLLVLLWICASVMAKNLPLALCGFFALAMQAAFFSPAKIGINKELVGSGHLGFATGIQQMTSMLAMLAGQIVAGCLFDYRYHAFGGTAVMAWRAALGPLVVVTALSVPALAMAWMIPRVPAPGARAFSWRLPVSHFGNLIDLWRDKPLRQASFGVAFFWGFAAYLNLWSVKLAKVLTGGGEGFGTLSSVFMAAASLGMAAGFGSAAYLLRKRIDLGWVPVAGVAMTVISLALVCVPPGGAVFPLTLGALAFSAAMFLAPVNAWMQDRYPAAKRGEFQSASNLQDCFAGIVAVLLVTAFEYVATVFGVDAAAGFRFQMVFVGLACALVTGWIIRLLPGHLVRVIGVTLIRAIYRIRVIHDERLPQKGGVLLLPNHVTFADAFFLFAASPRPVRFVMEEAFMKRRVIRGFTGIFDTMTIRRDRPLEAIRAIIHALEQGDVVCLFPEGQLTRTGTLSVLQSGFELIAKKCDASLVPVWCDGSWGSIFSFERNRFFRKFPRRAHRGLSLAIGHPISPDQANRQSVHQGLLMASAEAIGRRCLGRAWLSRMPRAKNPAAAAIRVANASMRRRMWLNGYQIGMINALQRRQKFHVLISDPLWAGLPGLAAAFPDMFGATVVIESSVHGHQDAGCWVGGDVLRDALLASRFSGALVFYDFGERALDAIERPGLCHCPCLAVAQTVVAMSMPHPLPSQDNFQPQHGHKPHSWGKLLPGWYLKHAPDGTLIAHGPAAPQEGIPLPPGAFLDPEGFLVGREIVPPAESRPPGGRRTRSPRIPVVDPVGGAC